MIQLITVLLCFISCQPGLVFSELEPKNTCISFDSQKESLRQINLTKDKSRKVRWAIITLARPGRTDAEMQMRNQNIIMKLKPYSNSHNITIIFFSEFIFGDKAVADLANEFKDVGSVRYIDTSVNRYQGSESFGYKYMCKFFAVDVYEYLKNDYDYYMRCDTDCYLQELNYDILQWSVDNNVGYGFAMRKIEAHKETRVNLPFWTEKYMRKCDLRPTAVMDVPLSTCFNFYNNFHIGNVAFFNRPDVQHFLLAVNKSGHILSSRWGDSTIQAYAVRLFMNPAAIVQVPEFSYIHGSHGNRLVSTFGDGHLTTVPQRLPNWKHEVPS
jgi:Glycolipid 2-alpha-mannosyltransferase